VNSDPEFFGRISQGQIPLDRPAILRQQLLEDGLQQPAHQWRRKAGAVRLHKDVGEASFGQISSSPVKITWNVPER
jgi:hypothetical protein